MWWLLLGAVLVGLAMGEHRRRYPKKDPRDVARIERVEGHATDWLGTLNDGRAFRGSGGHWYSYPDGAPAPAEISRRLFDSTQRATW